MFKEVKFYSVREVQAIQELACKMNVDVGLHSLDGSIIVDAKTFIGLFALNFDEPIIVVSESKEFFNGLSKCLGR